MCLTWFSWLGPGVGIRQRTGCAFILVTTVSSGFESLAAMVAHEYTVSRLLQVTLCVSHQHSAQATMEDSERIFTELIHSIERRCCEV